MEKRVYAYTIILLAALVLFTSTHSSCIQDAGCRDDCTYGTTRCVDSTTVQSCGNYDPDTCVEWGGTYTCSSGYSCSNGACAPPTCALGGSCPSLGRQCCLNNKDITFCSNYQWVYLGECYYSCDVNTGNCTSS